MTLSWRAPNMEGYPFDIVVTATYSLADDGLHLNISAYNNGDADAPWALAIHPWLANGFNGYGDEIDAHNAKVQPDRAGAHACHRQREPHSDRHRAGGRHQVRPA